MGLPPSEIPQGAIRFNTDSQKLEFYAQDQWWEMVIDTPNLGQGADTTAGARGVFGGGINPSPSANTNVIEYINISSTGNTVSFGQLTQARRLLSSCSSSTRGVFGGGYAPGTVNTIDYVTISSTGNATSFGILSQVRYGLGACSNSTRGIFNAGYSPVVPGGATNTVDYITIASTGNAVSFGNLTTSRWYASSSSSPTRGITAGGATPAASNVIDYVTISSLGNGTSFGSLSQARYGLSSCANATRSLFAGGQTPSSYFNTIEYVTIATLGNAVNFGSLTVTRGYLASCSSSIRGVFGGGYASPGATVFNTIDYVTILTQGNAVSFGNLAVSPSVKNANAACSNAHGGL